MKPKGKHPHKKLTAKAINSYSIPKKYSDGNGLYLVVDKSGNKRWLLRIVVRGKRRDIGLGGWPTVSLADARNEAALMGQIARKGGDPLEERRKRLVQCPTFREAAKRVHAEHSGSWKNAKHAAQWINTLDTYVFPRFGKLPVDKVGTADVIGALTPIWLTEQETARRVRQRIGTVLDWAKAKGYRNDENPVRSVTKALPKQLKSHSHHASLPYSEVSDFLTALRVSDSGASARLAFEFLILTAARTSEVILAQWVEIDLDEREWTIPAERMKARKEHRVPLSKRALEILTEARKLNDGKGLVFEGRKPGEPLSQMAFLMILRRMGKNITAHGFRSTFRDWAAEQTNFPREVCEAALAHTVNNKVEAAYFRSDLFEKRRKLMKAWSEYSTTKRAEVLPLRASA